MWIFPPFGHARLLIVNIVNQAFRALGPRTARIAIMKRRVLVWNPADSDSLTAYEIHGPIGGWIESTRSEYDGRLLQSSWVIFDSITPTEREVESDSRGYEYMHYLYEHMNISVLYLCRGSQLRF